VRLYSVAVTSVAIQAPEKWTDNLLSHHQVPGVQARSRGVSRGVSWHALVQIALVRELHIRLGCAVRDAVSFASAILASPTSALEAGSHLTVSFDRARFEHDLHRRLADALETAPRPRRGRPLNRTSFTGEGGG
jgi:hypothetical protein